MASKKFTAEQVIAAIREGHTPSMAARVLGCHPDTVRNYADRYPTVKRALMSERQDIVDLAEVGLRSAVVGQQPWAIAFALRTLARDIYTEHPGQSPVNNNEITLKVEYGDADDPSKKTAQ